MASKEIYARDVVHSAIDEPDASLGGRVAWPSGFAERWGVDPKRILIVGHSYGGYVAARAASEEGGIHSALSRYS